MWLIFRVYPNLDWSPGSAEVVMPWSHVGMLPRICDGSDGEMDSLTVGGSNCSSSSNLFGMVLIQH